MNDQQAIQEARNRWGYQATCSTQTTVLVNQDGKEETIEKTYVVGILAGKDIHIRGEGHSWLEAFKSADGYDRTIRELARRRTENQR